MELQRKEEIVLKTLKEVQEMDKGMDNQNQELYVKIKEIQERQEKAHEQMQEKIKEVVENVTEKQGQLTITESSKMVCNIKSA